MEFSSCCPFWNSLTAIQQKKLLHAATLRKVAKGEILHNGSLDCLGLVLVRSGQIRAFIFSEEGREITLYRLFDRDICLFSASCMLKNIQFEITVSAEKDSDVWIIPPDIFQTLREESIVVANYINQLMASRFSEVIWLIEQIMWKSMDQRLADFLYEECKIEGTYFLEITHEKIANHMGTAREVVTRMLRYFQQEEMVRLTRGVIEIIDIKKVRKLQSK